MTGTRRFRDSYLSNGFRLAVCDNCRDDEVKHKLISRTEAQQLYVPKDYDLDQREPVLRFVLRKNPTQPSLGRHETLPQAAGGEALLRGVGLRGGQGVQRGEQGGAEVCQPKGQRAPPCGEEQRGDKGHQCSPARVPALRN